MQAQTKSVVFSKINWIYFFSAVNLVPSNPWQALHQELGYPFFAINMYRRTRIYSKHYTISTKSITKWKLSFSDKSNSKSRISILINIKIFSEFNCSKQTIFQCWITLDVAIFTYLINNLNGHYFLLVLNNFHWILPLFYYHNSLILE